MRKFKRSLPREPDQTEYRSQYPQEPQHLHYRAQPQEDIQQHSRPNAQYAQQNTQPDQVYTPPLTAQPIHWKPEPPQVKEIKLEDLSGISEQEPPIYVLADKPKPAPGFFTLLYAIARGCVQMNPDLNKVSKAS